jgi:hypothetical protein
MIGFIKDNLGFQPRISLFTLFFFRRQLPYPGKARATLKPHLTIMTTLTYSQPPPAGTPKAVPGYLIVTPSLANQFEVVPGWTLKNTTKNQFSSPLRIKALEEPKP